MKKYGLFLPLILVHLNLIAQTIQSSSLVVVQETGWETSSPIRNFFKKNREDKISVVYLNTRFGTKLFSPIYDEITYGFKRRAVENDFAGTIQLPTDNYLYNIEVSMIQVVFPSNVVLDLIDVGYSWRGKRRQTGGIGNWHISTGVGYQLRIKPKFWLRSMMYIGYADCNQQVLRWKEGDDDDRYDVEIRQGQLNIRPELSLVKVLGSGAAGTSISLNLGYDLGFFKAHNVRLSDIDLGRKRSFEEYNLQHNNQPIRSIGFDPNRLVLSVGVGVYVSDFD